MRNFTLKFNLFTSNPKTGNISVAELKPGHTDLFKAPDYCVENIMNFAKTYRVAKSNTLGNVEMIMN